MNKVSVFDCSIIDIGKIQNRGGNVSVIESKQQLPFEIKRTFFLHDIQGGDYK